MSGEELELLEMGREQFTSLDADRQWDLFSELLAHVKSLTKDVEEMKVSQKKLMERNNELTAAATAHSPPSQPRPPLAPSLTPTERPTYAAIAQAHLQTIPVHDRERAQSLLDELRPLPTPRRPSPNPSSPTLSADKLEP
ncbi:hypothetical protein BT69DRAFT_1321949, partial [Atractiella rhizophila]